MVTTIMKKCKIFSLFYIKKEGFRLLIVKFVNNTKILYTSYYLFFVPNNNLFIIGILFNISVIIGKRIIVPINNII